MAPTSTATSPTRPRDFLTGPHTFSKTTVCCPSGPSPTRAVTVLRALPPLAVRALKDLVWLGRIAASGSVQMAALNYPNNPTGTVASRGDLELLYDRLGSRLVLFNDALLYSFTLGGAAPTSELASASTTTTPSSSSPTCLPTLGRPPWPNAPPSSSTSTSPEMFPPKYTVEPAGSSSTSVTK